MPVNSGDRPELPVGGHNTQCAPPPVPEARAAPPAAFVPVRPPPLAPLADDPDTAPPPVAAVAPAAVVAVPEAGKVGRAIAPPAAG